MSESPLMEAGALESKSKSSSRTGTGETDLTEPEKSKSSSRTETGATDSTSESPGALESNSKSSSRTGTGDTDLTEPLLDGKSKSSSRRGTGATDSTSNSNSPPRHHNHHFQDQRADHGRTMPQLHVCGNGDLRHPSLPVRDHSSKSPRLGSRNLSSRTCRMCSSRP